MKQFYLVNHGPTDFSMALCDGPFEKKAIAMQSIKKETNYRSWQLVRIGKETTVIDSSMIARKEGKK